MRSARISEVVTNIRSISKTRERVMRTSISIYQAAKKLVVETQRASTTYLQTFLKIGYPKAARVMQTLEQRGVVGPEVNKKREVLVKTLEEGKQYGDDPIADQSAVKNGRYKPFFYPFEGEGKKRTGSRFFFRSFEGFDRRTYDRWICPKESRITDSGKSSKNRQQYRMSYAEIAKATRIQAKYLESLENGEYEKLPAEVYVRGFLKSYARHLGLNDDVFS